MQPTTEATYAACLLECGPHDGKRSTDYYNRVYRWYCIAFYPNDPIHGSMADWIRFSHDYFDWVES